VAPLPSKRIGVLLPFTGALSEFGAAFRRAAELTQQHFSAAGYPIELVFADDETNPIPAVEAARKLVDVERAQVVVGGAASSVTIAVAESITIPKGIPQISYASTSPLITALPADQGKDFLFRTCPSDALQGVILGKLAQELGFKTAAVLYVNNPYGKGLADAFKASFEKRGGKLLESVPHDERTAPTYVAELRRAVANKPDVLVAISYPAHATIYLKEAVENNLIKQFLFVDGTKSLEIPKAVGAQNVEGMYGTAPGSVLSPSYDRFVAEYSKQYGEVPPLPFMTNVYDAIAVSGLAMMALEAKGQRITPTGIRDMLRTVANPPGDVVQPGAESLKQAWDLLKQGKDINYEGAAGAIDFDKNGDVVTPIEVWRYVNGSPVTARLEVEVPEA